jgi:hypothetical protein
MTTTYSIHYTCDFVIVRLDGLQRRQPLYLHEHPCALRNFPFFDVLFLLQVLFSICH